MIRKCVYTDKEAKSKDSILPKEMLGEEIHNWSSQVPANSDYLQSKQGRLPSELEMQANETFRLLELSKLRVKFYENKLAEIQKELLKSSTQVLKSSHKPTKSEKKKEKEIEQAIVEKEIVEISEKNIDQFLESKRKFWDED